MALKYVGTRSSVLSDVEEAGFSLVDAFDIPIGGGMVVIQAWR